MQITVELPDDLAQQHLDPAVAQTFIEELM
jgi:hypothetical protein